MKAAFNRSSGAPVFAAALVQAASPITVPLGTYSGPGASTPIWGTPPANIAAAHDLLAGASFAANQIGEGRGYSETAILTAPVGHGPGAV